MKKPRLGINTASKPSGDGCVECLAGGAGGCTSTDARNVDASDAATVLLASVPQSISQQRNIPWSLTTNRVRTGSLTTKSSG